MTREELLADIDASVQAFAKQNAARDQETSGIPPKPKIEVSETTLKTGLVDFQLDRGGTAQSLPGTGASPPPEPACPSADHVQLSFTGIDLGCGCVDTFTILGPSSISVTDDFGVNAVFVLPKFSENADQVIYQLSFASALGLIGYDFWNATTDCSGAVDGNDRPDTIVRLTCLKHDDSPFLAGTYVEVLNRGGHYISFFGFAPSSSTISNLVTCGGCPNADQYSCPDGQQTGISQNGTVYWVEV